MFIRTILILLISLINFYAMADEVFVIKNIKISANNKVASLARDEALENGEMKAFRGLVKLHYPEALNKIGSIAKDDIYSLVKGYEISDEKRSATRYIAKLKVTFSREHVDKLMNSIGVSFSESSHNSSVKSDNNSSSSSVKLDENSSVDDSNNIQHDIVLNDSVDQKEEEDQSSIMNTLIVPVFVIDHKEYWLDNKENIWLDVWQNNSQEDDVNKKFILPVADLEDLLLLNKDIFEKNLLDLSPLFEKYNVNNIAVYLLQDTKEQDFHLVSLKVNYINKYHYSWQSYNFATSSGEDLDKLLDQSYTQAQQFNFTHINNNLTKIDKTRIKVEFPVNDIADWVHLNKVLSTIQYISEVSLDSVTLNEYVFSFYSVISNNDLNDILKKHGFILEEQEGKFVLTKSAPYEKH